MLIPLLVRMEFSVTYAETLRDVRQNHKVNTSTHPGVYLGLTEIEIRTETSPQTSRGLRPAARKSTSKRRRQLTLMDANYRSSGRTTPIISDPRSILCPSQR